MRRLLSRIFRSGPSRTTASELALPRSLYTHQLPGYHACNGELRPNQAIDHLRRVELGLIEDSPFKAAPFSDDLILLPTDLEADIERMRRPGVHVRSDRDPGLVHIPIRSIVGVSNLHNLTHERGNDFQIATFGDALFEALHGASLIYPDSLDYLCSESVKAKGEMVQRDEMPQVEKISSNDPKYAAMGEMTFQRYGDRYIAFNGKQRTLIAIYAIWQRKGPDGILYNVRIT